LHLLRGDGTFVFAASGNGPRRGIIVQGEGEKPRGRSMIRWSHQHARAGCAERIVFSTHHERGMR
jgi:hypothetical protein